MYHLHHEPGAVLGATNTVLLFIRPSRPLVVHDSDQLFYLGLSFWQHCWTVGWQHWPTTDEGEWSNLKIICIYYFSSEKSVHFLEYNIWIYLKLWRSESSSEIMNIKLLVNLNTWNNLFWYKYIFKQFVFIWTLMKTTIAIQSSSVVPSPKKKCFLYLVFARSYLFIKNCERRIYFTV